MYSKPLLFAFILILAIQNPVTSQNTGKKINKTNSDIKKADDAVVFLGKILKKKDKSKKQQDKTKDTIQNITSENTPIKNEEQVLSSIISKEKVQDVPLTKDAALLFKNTISKTSNAEKNSILAAMNFKATKDGNQFYINDPYYKEYPFAVSVYLLDINND